jgi:outer membrane lipoprotein carrier protein
MNFIMKYIFVILISVSFQLAAQQDPEARAILDRVAAKTKLYQSIQADFSLIIFDHKENKKNTSTGKIIVKGEKYKVISSGTEVYFDGKTMWNYVSANNEVTITESAGQDDDFISNPANIFEFYNRDFKYAYRGETTIDSVRMHEIDLFPKNLNQSYSRIKIFISKQNEQLKIVSAVGKDGVDYSFFIHNMVPDKVLPDAIFTFDPAKHKKISIVDMRGL